MIFYSTYEITLRRRVEVVFEAFGWCSEQGMDNKNIN